MCEAIVCERPVIGKTITPRGVILTNKGSLLGGRFEIKFERKKC